GVWVARIGHRLMRLPNTETAMMHSVKFSGLLLSAVSLSLMGCDRLPLPAALRGASEEPAESGTEYQVTYQCRDDVSFTARLSDEDAIANLPDQPEVVLPRVVSASGAKYSDGTTTLWDQGGEAYVEVDGALLLVDCQTTELVETATAPVPDAAPEADPEADPATTTEATNTGSLGQIPAPVPGGTNGYCDVYPTGSANVSVSIPCNVSQRQGMVYIDREDGVNYVLEPVNGRPDSYLDQTGQPAYRQAGLGENGQIYRLATETVYVYWNQPADVAAQPPETSPAPPPQTSQPPSQPTRPASPSPVSPTASAPCDTEPEATFEAEDYFVFICRQAGQLQYIGVEKGTANSLVTNEVTPRGNGYVAVNGNYEYRIDPTALLVYRIEDGNYVEIGNEAVLSTTRAGG
ncbi:MAG: MliC family protein, partial [Cyanobacteria bacterium P01_A01_bin.135]